MKKPIIGIPGYHGKDAVNFGVGTNYLEFISKFGNPRIIMPWEDTVKVDLLFLPGGLDVNPSNYNQVPGFKTTSQDVFKQYFFDHKLEKYIQNTPIFGVCLGMQQLAVRFGSKLTQNLIFHEQSSARWESAHTVYDPSDLITKEDGVIYPEPKKHYNNSFKVNSHHHQGVKYSELGKELKALKVAPLYNIDAYNSNFELDVLVEAFQHSTLPIVGVQWHPEEFYDNFSIKIIYELLNFKK
jgi:putative glutamine amidotransferase